MSNPNLSGTKAIVVIVLGIAVLAGSSAWRIMTRKAQLAAPASNALMIIAPYWYDGTWVFDDAQTGLKREPFVSGVPEMIDILVKDIPDARAGFRLLFSARPFPGFQHKLTWLRGDSVGGGGNYYKMDNPPLEGWICPALFKYYQGAPKEIYVQAEPLKH